jgi:hypothetical protein
VDCNHYFFRGEKLAKLAILVNKFWGRLRYFYDHLSDFLQPDFRFGIFLSLIATISWAFGLYTKKSGLQSLFQSWITNGNIEQLPFHHYWSDWHRCQHHQHSGNIMVGDCLFSDNRFRFKLYCIYLYDTKTSAGN